MDTDARGDRQRFAWFVAPAALIVLAIAGCSSVAAPSASGPASQPTGSTAPIESPGASDAHSPVGTVLPPGGSGPGPGSGGRIVVPQPGQLDVRAIPAESLSATVNGHRVVVTVTFTTGVEPCYVLDSVAVERGVRSFAITLRQGRGPGNKVCIEIAETKRTLVDLGELAAGTYAISDATGGAPPISVVVT